MRLFDFYNKAFGILKLIFKLVLYFFGYFAEKNVKNKKIQFSKKLFLIFFLGDFLESFTLNDTFLFFIQIPWYKIM